MRISMRSMAVISEDYATFGTYFDTEALRNVVGDPEGVGRSGPVLENPRTITPAAPLTVYAGQGQVLDEPMILPKARPREAPVVRDRHTDAASQALASVVALLDLK